MANNNKFDINKYIHFGYATYSEYETIAKKRGVGAEYLILEDAYKYLKLIEDGYSMILEDIQDILEIENRNTVQVKIMKDIDKMYINKPVKDLLYLATNKKYKDGISDFEKALNLDGDIFLLNNRELRKSCNKLNLDPSFLIKRTFIKREDIENMIRDIMKKEVIEHEIVDNTLVKKISYSDISNEDLNLIMNKKLKSDKSIRKYLGLSNLNQIQRRIAKGELKGYKGRFIMQNDGSRRPLVRYLIDAKLS